MLACYPGLVLLTLSYLSLAPTKATQGVKPVPPEHRLDFWIGEWELTGKQRVAPDKEDWQETNATNSIRATHKGNVIEERFSMPGFEGGSVSVYDRRTGAWKQTWVDDQGSYLDFAGEWTDGRMIFSRKAAPNGKPILQRMVFRDIQPDSFTWDWETSRDEGKSWRLMWQLNYRRRPKPTGTARAGLDFWIGHWSVKDAKGRLLGTNRIERILDGSAIIEHWRDVEGNEGKSFFYYLPTQDRWKQVWVTPEGVVKEKLSEPIMDGIRFVGQAFLPAGRTLPDRTSLTRLANGDVKQVIQSSRDYGANWITTFEATYTRQ